MRRPRNATSNAATKVTGRALRLTVLLGDNDTWHHRPLFTEIVHRAHQAGLAGASVFHGVEGFGATSLIHTTRLLSMADDLPVAVVIVDAPERIRAFLPQLDELATEGLITVDEVESIRYVRHADDDAAATTPAAM